MALQVFIDGRPVDHSSLEASAVDPGGFEACQVTLEQGVAPAPGALVRVSDGWDVVWEGIVEEPGQRHDGGRQGANVTGVGEGVALKRNPFPCIYIDRDLSKWKPVDARRELALSNAGYDTFGHEVKTGLKTTLKQPVKADWSRKPVCEAFYDAGLATLGEMRAGISVSATINISDLNWFAGFVLGDTDPAFQSGYSSSGDQVLAQATKPEGVVVKRPGSRLGLVTVSYELAPVTGVQGREYYINWHNLRVIGDHGLPIRGRIPGTAAGDEVEGVNATDVVLHAVRTSQAAVDVVRADASSIVVPHLVYYDRTPAEKQIADMATLLGGWHWGVWERPALGGRPQFHFSKPPSEPTAVVNYRDLVSPDITEKLSAMHNRVVAAYENGSGARFEVVADKPHPRIPPGMVQSIELEVGLSTAEAAKAIGLTTLTLDQQQSRVAGSAGLPPFVRTLTGRLRPSHLLRPGRDRLQIVGLPVSSGLLDDAAARLDAFRVRRISVSDSGGTTRTRVEFDAGADLIETLQARLATAR